MIGPERRTRLLSMLFLCTSLFLPNASGFPRRFCPSLASSSASSHQVPTATLQVLGMARDVAATEATVRNKFGGDVALIPPPSNTVVDDIPLYITLALMQLLPPLSIFLDAPVGSPEFMARKALAYFYFVVTASLTVVLGSRRSDIKVFEGESLIGPRNAIAAPFISSAILFTFYTVLRSANFESFFETSYQILALLIGGLSIDTIISLSFINNVSSKKSASVEETAMAGNDVSTSTEGLIVSSIAVLGYLFSSILGNHEEVSTYFVASFFNNMIAVSIALLATSLVRVKNFATCCALLSGLFFYDVYFVFGSDIMMTVATKVEAPVKMLFPASVSAIPERPYPYSVLGLGDVVVPGIMSAFAHRFDCMKKEMVTDAKEVAKTSGFLGKINVSTESLPTMSSESHRYLDASVVGYIMGLLLAFAANEVMQRGQPALLYLVPTVITSMFITSLRNEEFGLLWGEGFNEAEKV